MSWPLLVVVTLVLVVVFGVVAFKLARGTKDVVPDTLDRQAANQDRVVAVDESGEPVMESQEGDVAGPHDDAGFDGVLKDQLDDLRG